MSALIDRNRIAAAAPGVLIAFVIAAAAQFISEHYGAPVMLFALLIGMAFNFLSEPESKCAPGVEYASSRLLKIGVALLGVRVTVGQIASLGVAPIVMIPILIGATIASGLLFAKIFNKSRAFGLVTGGAVAICGASAALALSSVMPKSEEMRRDTIFTVVAVTTLSTLAMIFYPVVFSAFGLDDTKMGVLIGATIHDVAQVVGAGYAVSEQAGDVATYVKLLRVACLPIVVIGFAFAFRNSGGREGSFVFPWFAVGFAVILAANSVGLIPEVVRAAMDETSRWLLIAAIAALGMKTSLKAMLDLGPRHIGVVLAETALLAGLSMAVVLMLL
ncbi:MAG: putative sulfate exporter family transporter [Pseudomonadota bacterium]